MALVTVKEITSAIAFGDFTNDDLTKFIDAIKYNRAQLGSQIKRALVKGDAVKFTSSRSGLVMTGTVDKVAIKNVMVMTSQGRWKVPPNMLEMA